MIMAEKKSKENKKTKETFDETPKLVEVYGDDVKKDQKKEIKNIDEKENIKEEMDSIDNKEKDAKKTPEEIVEEIIEERQAFKTEVVGEEEAQDSKVKGQSEDDREASKKEEKVTEEESSTKTKIDKDEMAFEDEIGSQRSAVKGVFGVGVFVFLIIFGLTGWAFYLKSVWLPKETVSEVIVEASPEPTIVSTPEEVVESLSREEITLDVLNGSGVSGLAGKTATTFEELGYEIGEIGNADSVEATELYIQEELEDQLETLLEDVKDELGVASVSGYLESDDEITARLILGN